MTDTSTHDRGGGDASEGGIPAVICDDDAIARGIIANMLSEAGFEVIAETDSAAEAATLIERFGVREVVIDLSLAVGRGEDLLSLVRGEKLPCKTIIFSAYIANPDNLLAAGASAVIEKPDFEKLEQTLGVHAAQIKAEAPTTMPADRRRPSPPREHKPQPQFRSPSGFVPPSELEVLIGTLADGDVVMVFDVSELEQIQHNWGDLIAADHRVALARAVRWATRADDELAVTEEGEVVVLLLRPNPDTPSAVHRRVMEAWGQSGATGDVRAASATCRPDEPRRGTLGRALGGVRTMANPGAVTFT